MELRTLINKTAPLAIDYHGDQLNANIFTDRMTPTKKVELDRILDEEGEEQKDSTVLFLSEVIESWDMVFEGETYAPTYENLMQISYPLLSHLLREVSSFLGARANPATI
jgi:hypothetical protein